MVEEAGRGVVYSTPFPIRPWYAMQCLIVSRYGP